MQPRRKVQIPCLGDVIGCLMVAAMLLVLGWPVIAILLSRMFP